MREEGIEEREVGRGVEIQEMHRYINGMKYEA